MSGRGKSDRFFAHDGGFTIVPPSLYHRAAIASPSLPPSLPPSFNNVEALQGVYFWGVAMIGPFDKKGGF